MTPKVTATAKGWAVTVDGKKYGWVVAYGSHSYATDTLGRLRVTRQINRTECARLLVDLIDSDAV